MLTKEAREAKAQQWLERLRSWRAEGKEVSLAQFARAQGWKVFDAYRWAKTLRREGRWEQGAARPVKTPAKPASAAARFIRVRLASVSTPSAIPLTLRVRLANGRSGELSVEGIEQLLQVLSALERTA